ncbi:hypothetical protein G7067_08085 [Leucobacter insecticola]|uniref:POTRA domain-containing protein n=1 Tax=Leucobacter insecticola TaxID=2714934 RepID=A0A6G8FIW1_9MICO|nr:hypothetical protein [Leucobacter insecticola]QIM16390.1 hypothetical protein G7067_08085 [Leucobacter insecticola]
MKRPGGFDRAPQQPDRPKAELPEVPESHEPRSLPRLRSTLFRRRGAAEQPAPGLEATEASEAAGIEAFETLEVETNDGFEDEASLLGLEAAELESVSSEIRSGEAETIDLGEVRRARDLVLADSAEGGGVRGALARFRSERDEDPVRQAEQRVREAKKERRQQEKRESRRFSADARRRRRHWLIALGTVCLLALFVAVGVFTPLMSVRQVQLVGANSVNAAEVEKALSRFDGVPLALVQESEIHDALQPFPFVQRYAFELIPRTRSWCASSSGCR